MANEAVITDPLKANPKYREARQAAEKARQQLDRTKKRAKADGTVTAKERGRIKDRKGDLKQAKFNRNSIKNKFADPRANVVEFDAAWMWDKVKEILSPKHELNQAWDLLHESNNQLNELLSGTNQIAEGAANNQALLQQDAMRMSLLLGAPLPEKAASHVLVGDQRQEVNPRDRGRRSLRIDPTPSPSLAI